MVKVIAFVAALLMMISTVAFAGMGDGGTNPPGRSLGSDRGGTYSEGMPCGYGSCGRTRELQGGFTSRQGFLGGYGRNGSGDTQSRGSPRENGIER